MIYLISDTHFNHKNIITYENRPFSSISEMNDEMIKRWNAVVKPEDTVIHLGDVGLGNESTLKGIVPQLNGHKILIKGNHDTKSKNFYLECGFEEVVSTKLEVIDGVRIYFSHRPESRPGDGSEYDIHLYGHVHTLGCHDLYPTIARNGACLCVERWNYTPVQLSKVLDMCKESDIYNNCI